MGKFFAKAVLDRQALPVRFTRCLCRQIIAGTTDVSVTLADFAEEYPDMARNLQALLAPDMEEETLRDFSFTVSVRTCTR